MRPGSPLRVVWGRIAGPGRVVGATDWGMADEVPVRVVDNAAGARYEIYLGDTLAGFSTYRDKPGKRIVLHTEISPEFEHHGLAGELARALLDDIRRRGLKVVPRCPYVARFISTHPDFADLVTT
jgi:uncharacterized protein